MKRRIAPILVTLLLLIVLGGYFFGINWAINGIFGVARWISYIFMAGITIAAIAIVITLIGRLKEIKEDEKDDLSQY